MKRDVDVLIFSYTLSVGTNAQDFRFGGKAGANLNKITGKEFKEEFDLGYHLGAFVEVDLIRNGVSAEVLWNQTNTDVQVTLMKLLTAGKILLVALN
jgi:hypothetical protein